MALSNKTAETFPQLPAAVRQGFIDDQRSRIAALKARHRPTQATRDEIAMSEAELVELEEIHARVQEAERASMLDRIRSAGQSGSDGVVRLPGTRSTSNPADPYYDTDADNDDRDDSTARMFGGTSFGEARRTIDAAARTGLLPDDAAQKATALVEQGKAKDRAVAAQWAVATGDPDYLGAFAKLCANPERGHLLWTDREQAAYRRVEEFRAMSLTDAQGGYAVPLTLDPAILLSSAGSVDPMRQVSRIVQTATDQWQGVTSAGVTAQWLAENAESTDNSPTLAGPSIPVHKGSAFVPFSIEVGMDARNFTQEMARLLVDAADQLMAAAFVNGTGVGQPTGLVTALPAGSRINTAAPDVLAAADVYKPQNALPPRFQPNARWMANLPTINAIQAMETAAGSKVFPDIATDRLLRKPLHENSTLKTPGATAAAANDPVLVYGDFSNFVIVDRIGTTIELVPMLFGPNRLPIGQRGFYMFFRAGSDVEIDDAFRLLMA